MKTSKLLPLMMGAMLVAACEQQPAQQPTTESAPSAPAVSREDAVAVVNGQYISKAALQRLEQEVSQRMGGQSVPQQALLDELIMRELLIQEANKQNLQNSPEITERLAMIRQSLLSQAALQHYLEQNPITDEAVKAEYDKQTGGDKPTEYKAKHILVKTEDEAKKIIAQLDKGANFEELAKKHSTDPSVQMNGGDLGWFTADRMVAPFSEGVMALQNGQYSKTPVQSQFGWHVILREDAREQTPPPFEAVKEQIRASLQRQAVQNYMQSLKANANIEVLLPPPAPEAPPAQESAPASAEGETAPAPASGLEVKVETLPEQPEVKPAEEAPAPAPETATPTP